jgi:hypothetical protein
MSIPTAARVLLAVALALAGTLAAGSPDRTALGAECTVRIPPRVDRVDAAGNFRKIGPGAVVCLPSGERGNIKLFNLHGTAEQPIVVRNDGGPVTITGTQFGDGGIIIAGSSFLRLTGTGTEETCGADFSRRGQRCGIVIDGAKKGVKIVTSKGDVHDLEIDHVAVERVSQDVKTRGILMHPLPGQVISGIHVHHNFVANTLAEGIYLGSEPHGQPFESLAKLERLEVDHNLVMDVGFDGIKIKVAIADVAVHHNVIRNAGISRTPAHQGGIKVAMSVGDYYNNTVIQAVEGIRTGRRLESPGTGTRYFNNLVIDVVDVGIEASEDGAQIYNNIVAVSQRVGISALGRDTVVARNIVAEAQVPFQVDHGQSDQNFIVYAGELQ